MSRTKGMCIELTTELDSGADWAIRQSDVNRGSRWFGGGPRWLGGGGGGWWGGGGGGAGGLVGGKTKRELIHDGDKMITINAQS